MPPEKRKSLSSITEEYYAESNAFKLSNFRCSAFHIANEYQELSRHKVVKREFSLSSKWLYILDAFQFYAYEKSHK